MLKVDVPFQMLNQRDQEAVVNGFPWGCMCGDVHATRDEAEACPNYYKYLDGATFVYFTERDRHV